MRAKYAFATALAVASVGSASALGGPSAPVWEHHDSSVWCKSQSGGALCVPSTGRGYGVAIHRNFVFVMNLNSGKIVFKRAQPR